MKANGKQTKRIAPRLLDGSNREQRGHGLPPIVNAWLRADCERRGISVSFRLETLVLAEYGRTHRRLPAYRQASRKGRG